MKKEFIYGFIFGILILGLFSYKTTNGDNTNGYANNYNVVYNIPLKQTDVIVLSDLNKVKIYLKKGYVCEDMDVIKYDLYPKKFYTLVKY